MNTQPYTSMLCPFMYVYQLKTYIVHIIQYYQKKVNLVKVYQIINYYDITDFTKVYTKKGTKQSCLYKNLNTKNVWLV